MSDHTPTAEQLAAAQLAYQQQRAIHPSTLLARVAASYAAQRAGATIYQAQRAAQLSSPRSATQEPTP